MGVFLPLEDFGRRRLTLRLKCVPSDLKTKYLRDTSRTGSL